MKAPGLLDAAAAHVLEFEWLRNAVAPLSSYGQRAFDSVTPFVPGEELAAQTKAQRIAHVALHTAAGRLDAARAVLRAVPDAMPAIARAAIGGILSDPSLLELRRFCAAVAELEVLLGSDAGVKLENGATLRLGEALATAQDRDDQFYLSDAFDAELVTARRKFTAAQAELDAARGREIERVARELGRSEVGDEFIVMRSDFSGDLPPGVRIVREAPTYFLCEIEFGDVALAALRRRDGAAALVADAEERVRAAFSRMVRDDSPELNAAANALGEVDVLLAAVHFTRRYGCVPAAVVPEPAVEFEGARFPPMESELAAVGRSFVPLDIRLDGVAVLTGPNMGGKSVALRTCGFLALCTAFGLPVPAARARIGIFGRIAWLGIGREEPIGGLLSAFAREVLALKELLARDAAPLLILSDEFARTTTPREGKALVVALLARMQSRGACGLVATHLEGVAGVANARHFAVRGLREIPQGATADVNAALTALAGSMDYRLTEVTGDGVTRADAIALASLLGVDKDFIEAARRAFLK